MAAPDKRMGKDWVDRDLAALRHAVEREAPRHNAPIEIHAGSPRRRLRVVGSPELSEPESESPTTRILAAALPLLSRAPRMVRRHQGDLVFMAFCVGVTIGAVWVALWLGSR